MLLFSYGTLRQREIQLSTFGRELVGTADRLPGYAVSMLRITDPDVIAVSGLEYHPVVRATGNPDDEVEGIAFELTDAELASADEYEVSEYTRAPVSLLSGTQAWVYAASHLPSSDFRGEH